MPTTGLQRKFPVYLAICVLALISGTASADDEPVLAFHAVVGGWTSEAFGAGSVPLGLEYAEEPWLTEVDLVAWDLSSHWIYLARDKWTLLERFKSSPAAGPAGLRPFIVLVRGEPCFVGEFHDGAAGDRPFPHFDAISLSYQPVDVIVLNRGTRDEDDRALPCLVETLHELGLARPGVEVAISNVWISHPPDRDQSMVECEITLTNPGSEDLMVPDPAVLGDQFYYLSWGLHLQARDDPSLKISRPLDGMMAGGLSHQNFLVRLPAGATIRRTLAKTVQRVPPGTYICGFDFPGMPGNTRTANGTAVWHGVAAAAPVEVVVGD